MNQNALLKQCFHSRFTTTDGCPGNPGWRPERQHFSIDVLRKSIVSPQLQDARRCYGSENISHFLGIPIFIFAEIMYQSCSSIFQQKSMEKKGREFVRI